MIKVKISEGKPFPMGAYNFGGYINMAVSVPERHILEIHIFDKNSKKRIAKEEIQKKYRIGDVYSFALSGFDFENCCYNYFDGENYFTDPYAYSVTGSQKWGEHRTFALFPPDKEFDWEGDERPAIPFSELVVYSLHVRGFSKGQKNEHAGTFEAIIDSIPYFKELGINQLEIMPAYEFDEVMKNEKLPKYDSKLPKDSKEAKELKALYKKANGKKLNYWGYTTKALYFSPKAAYSATGDGVSSFKRLVKELHKNKIELVMQLYVSKDTSPSFINDMLRYYRVDYHIDGFNVMGDVPVELLANEPILADTKLYFRNLPSEDTLNRRLERNNRNVAVLKDDFMYDMRRFLKSDEDMLKSFTNHQHENPWNYGVLNTITNYYGFTLNDLVSYERKHNEDNGEENRDGSDYNFSWNCGVEGVTRKKGILKLRKNQMFNALTFLFLSAGIPVLRMGDEFANSQKGNNNAYCQDNKITWLDWEDKEKHRDIYEFVKKLINFRKKYPVFGQDKQLTMMDVEMCGYPDLSYHGSQAFYPHFENYNRHMGCMYVKNNTFVYAAYNMYWSENIFALPKLPKKMHWEIVMDTARGFLKENEIPSAPDSIRVMGRSVMLLVGEKD